MFGPKMWWTVEIVFILIKKNKKFEERMAMDFTGS